MTYKYNRKLEIGTSKLIVTIDNDDIIRTGSQQINDILNGRVKAIKTKTGFSFRSFLTNQVIEEYKDYDNLKDFIYHIRSSAGRTLNGPLKGSEVSKQNYLDLYNSLTD